MSGGSSNIYVQSNSDQEIVKSARKTLQTIQNINLEKENLVGRLHAVKEQMLTPGKPVEKKSPSASASVQTNPSDLIQVHDLTDPQPSALYWEALAEERRARYQELLLENYELKEKVESLEKAVEIRDEMLAEARELIDAFTEVVEEKEKAERERLGLPEPEEEEEAGSEVDESGMCSMSEFTSDFEFKDDEDEEEDKTVDSEEKKPEGSEKEQSGNSKKKADEEPKKDEQPKETKDLPSKTYIISPKKRQQGDENINPTEQTKIPRKKSPKSSLKKVFLVPEAPPKASTK